MDLGVCTDIVIRLQSAGKKLVAPLDGSEELDYAARELASAFDKDEEYTDEDISLAVNAYMADEEMTVLTGKLFKAKMSFYGISPIPLSKEALEKRAIRQRTNSRMFDSFSRCLSAGLREDFHKFFPDDKTLTNFAVSKGFQANELLISHEDGGQKLALQQFFGEYNFMKSINRSFPWKLVKQGNEAVLLPIDQPRTKSQDYTFGGR